MADAHAARSKRYRETHGDPVEVFASADGTVTVEAFEQDFTPDEDDQDLGYVLITNGMSDRCMHLDAVAEQAFARGEVKRRAELIWYVRELDEPYVETLLWLAAFPFIDETWLGFGHTVLMPEPLFTDSDLTAFLLLTPIIDRHVRLAEKLVVDGDGVELLVVHLLTKPEYELKRAEGVDAILALFDANPYPLVLDPCRSSLV